MAEGYPGDLIAFNDYLKFIGVDKIKEYGKKYLKGPQYEAFSKKNKKGL